MKAVETKRTLLARLGSLSEQDLASVSGGSGKGGPTPGLNQPMQFTPINTYLQSHPLPPSTRVNMGPYQHPPAGGFQVSAAGGTGMPTQFGVGVSGGSGPNVASVHIYGSTHPNGAHGAQVGIGRRF